MENKPTKAGRRHTPEATITISLWLDGATLAQARECARREGIGVEEVLGYLVRTCVQPVKAAE